MARRRNDARRPAFTLLELLVVMVVMAVMAVLIVPLAASMGGSSAQGVARLVVTDLEYAQNNAILTQGNVTVAFNTTGNSYTLSNASGPLIHPITKKSYQVTLGPASGLGNAALAAPNFGGAASVTFGALGAPDNSGTVQVACGSSTYTITVAPLTGRVSVNPAP